MSRKDLVATVAVRLTPEEYGLLLTIGRAGEPHAHTFTRLLREAVLDRDVLLRYRKQPLVPDWFVMGPLAADDAVFKAEHLQRRGWQVELARVPPVRPAPAWPGDEEDEEDEEDGEGGP